MKKIVILSLILCLFGATQAQTSKSSTGKSSSKSTYTGTGKASVGNLYFIFLFINNNLFDSSSIDTCLKVYWLFTYLTKIGVFVTISFSINDKLTAVLVLVE